jgi:hypothetical protein
MALKKHKYKVTYSGTRHFNTYSTKKAALGQARYAVGTGNMKSCIFKKLPHSWAQIQCVTRRQRR